MRKTMVMAGTAGLAIAFANAATGQQTSSYSYDALGRLTGTVISAGTTVSRSTTSCFDAAGNRIRYKVGASASAPCSANASAPTPTPTPTPTSTPIPGCGGGGGGGGNGGANSSTVYNPPPSVVFECT